MKPIPNSIMQHVDGFDRILSFQPAFDHRKDGTGRGAHCVEMRFILRGPHGASQFLLLTNMNPPETNRRMVEMSEERPLPRILREPWGADVGVHSPKPLYEGQTVMPDECPFVEGGTCYYDGSSLRCEPLMGGVSWSYEFTTRGPDAIWALLREEYRQTFEMEQ